MPRSPLAALVACSLLGGCATGGNTTENEYAGASYTPVGTYVPKKAPSRLDNVLIVDKQSLENARDNGSAAINPNSRN